MNITYKSYDIFDTAIVRSVMFPDHVHWAVGMALKDKGVFSDCEQNWRKLRIEAENAARKSSRGREITMRNIFEIISSTLNWDLTTLDLASEIELSIEESLVHQVAKIHQRIECDSKDSVVIFISDMYIDSERLYPLLKKCGYQPKKIFCSADSGLTKRSGSLYEGVIKALGTDRNKIFHIGDNFKSDIRRSRKAGIKSLQFLETSPTRYEIALWSSGSNDLLGSIIAGSARAARLSYNALSATEEALWRVATGVAAPVLTAFVCWLLADAHSRGVRKLFFLARDGQVLVQIAKLAVNWAKLDIECNYMMASRQALFMPSLPDSISLALEEVGVTVTSKKLRQLFLELEFPDHFSIEFSRKYDAQLDDFVSAKTWASLRSDKDFTEKVKKNISCQKLALNSYLQDIGFLDGQNVGIVDLGWRGNLQLRLERCLRPDSQKPLGYYYSLDFQPDALVGRVFQYVKNQSVCSDILETFCMATHATVQNYVVKEDGMSGITVSKTRRDGPTLWAVSSQQEAIIQYTKILFSSAEAKAYTLEYVGSRLRSSSMEALELFRTRPDPFEAEAYGSVVHTADQTHLYPTELAPRLTKNTLRQFVTKEVQHGTNWSWRHGTMIRSLPTWTYKNIASLQMLLFKFQKRLRRKA